MERSTVGGSAAVRFKIKSALIDLCLHLRRLSSPSSPSPPLIAVAAATAIVLAASPDLSSLSLPLLLPSLLPLFAVADTSRAFPPLLAATTATVEIQSFTAATFHQAHYRVQDAPSVGQDTQHKPFRRVILYQLQFTLIRAVPAVCT
ncbi:hypothetical protein C8R43DRAFT_1244588 [Mycena crocata]|nr:hypothetical protein C8R43DRAFT_1244588 [Mycena crocata]